MPWAAFNWGALVVTSYLIGTLPSAYLATRLFRGQDIRRLGDSNAGAANVFRSVDRIAGVAVALVDLGKGVVVVLLARGWTDSSTAAMLAGASAVAGHNWPVYLQWRGGRGAATVTGVLLALMPLAAAPLLLLGVVVLVLRRSTVKALACGFIPLPLAAWAAGYPYPLVVFSVGLPILVGLSHFFSIRRKPIPAVMLSGHPAPPSKPDQG